VVNVATRRRIRAPEDRTTVAEVWLAAIREHRRAASRITFPSTRYREDPVAFFREIVGVEPWAKQVEILEAVRDHPRVAIASGHKVSKSHSAAGLALWYYCSFPDARAVMSSTTARQVDQILWRELKMMRARGGRCLTCKTEDPDGRTIPRPCPHSAVVGGEIGELARTGLKSDDFREIVGFTAREAEAVAGISGRNLMYIIDEASGVPEAIFEAIEGNRAGGARIVLFSNPTKTSGEFFDAFHSKAQFYHTIRVSSEETPNVVQGKAVIPGLATREWIEEKKQEWGEDSPLYKVRVRGEFALNEDGKIFSIDAIAKAEQRWEETQPSGRLFIGLDPSGESGTGDEAVYAVRRGLKAIELVAHRGLTEEGHLAHLLSMVEKHRLPRETPVVVLDREGAVGSRVYGTIKTYAEANPNTFTLVAVRASDRAHRMPQVYDRMRDELTANLESWIRDGGAIPEDARLAAELHEPEWIQQQSGRLKVTPKKDIRKEIGRSPDRYDALCLATWEPLSLREGVPDSARRRDVQEDHPEQALDPYAGVDVWSSR
jgi:phage terminase large subunit